MTKEITIQGLMFTVASPYVTGHICTDAEAKALNQTRHENIRNNSATKIKKLMAENEVAKAEELPASILEAIVADVTAYDAEYQFTLASVGGGRTKKDPIEIEAGKIARSFVMAKLQEQGKALKDVNKEAFAAKVAEVAEMEPIIKAAKKAIADRNKLAEGGLADFTL